MPLERRGGGLAFSDAKRPRRGGGGAARARARSASVPRRARRANHAQPSCLRSPALLSAPDFHEARNSRIVAASSSSFSVT